MAATSPRSNIFHSPTRPSASGGSGSSTGGKSLDPIMMSAGGCYDDDVDDDATRICGPAIIQKLLTRNNQKKLQHHQKSLNEDEQSSKSCLVSARQFVSPRRLAKQSQHGPKLYDDLMSVDQAARESPQESTDAFSRLSVCAGGVVLTEEREDSETIPEFVTQLSAEEREQMEKIKREGIPHPLTPMHGQQQRRHTMSGNFDLSPVVEEALSYNSPKERLSNSPQGKRSFSPQRDIDRLLTTSTASMSSPSIIQQIENLETMNAESQYGETEDTHHLRDESSSEGLSSPDKMKVLATMREIILKQQDALKKLADENTYLKDKLTTTAEEIKGMRKESAEKEAWSIRLNLEKDAFESEAKWLREEVKALRLEVSELKGEDEDLKHRFESLINKSSEDDKDTVPCSSNSESYEYSEPGSFDKEEINPEKSFGSETISTFSDRSEVDSVASPKDSKWWKKMAESLDQNESMLYAKPESSVATTPRRSNSARRDKKSRANKFKVESPLTRKDSQREEFGEESSVEDASVTSNSATICGSKAKSPPKSYVKNVVSAINAEQKKQEVDMFKNRLDEIQKRRVKRQIEQREFQQMTTSTLLYRNSKKQSSFALNR